LWRQNPFRRRVPLAGSDRQEALPHARRCTGDAIAERRQIQALLGDARKLLEEMK